MLQYSGNSQFDVLDNFGVTWKNVDDKTVDHNGEGTKTVETTFPSV